MAERKQQHRFHTKLHRFVALICSPFVNNLLWSVSDPHRFAARNFQYRFSINMLSCVIGDQQTGPFFFLGVQQHRTNYHFFSKTLLSRPHQRLGCNARAFRLSGQHVREYGQFCYNVIVAVL